MSPREAREAARELRAWREEQRAPIRRMAGVRWPERAIVAGINARLRRRWLQVVRFTCGVLGESRSVKWE